MKTIMIMAVAVVGLAAGTARGAEPEAFTGMWVNIDPETTSITRMEIGIFKTSFTVHAWARCIPECDWGTVNVPIPLRLGNTFTAQYDFGFATKTLTITLVSPNSLHVHKLTEYAPGDPRPDIETDDYFQREGSGPALPDLQITKLTIPKPVVVHWTVPLTWVTATLRNNGPGILSAGTIKAVFDSCTLNGEPVSQNGFIPFEYTAPLMPGQEVTHDFAVGENILWAVGCYTIRLRLDPDNAIAESNERNNLSPALSFDVAEERFLAGTIEYNNQPLTDFTQVPILDPWIRDLTTDEPLEDFFFWYNTQTGHYLFSGLPNDELWIQEHIRIAGPTDILGGNYRIGHTVDMPSLTDAEAMAYDIPVERIVHLLEPQDNGQILEYSQAYWQCPGTRFEWEPLVGAVKYRVKIDTYRDGTHPSGWGFEAIVLETEVTDPTYTPDVPVLPELLHYQMTIAGYNAADEMLGSYWYSFAGVYTGYGFDYRFKVCPSCARADINRDCRVNLLDFAILAEEWLVDTR
jgi:hypothetical protein